MNALSLNSLWSYIQSLSLTASNKKWLADHLYEAVKEEAKADKRGKRLQITQDDLILSADMLEPVKGITPLPADFDFDKARQK